VQVGSNLTADNCISCLESSTYVMNKHSHLDIKHVKYIIDYILDRKRPHGILTTCHYNYFHVLNPYYQIRVTAFQFNTEESRFVAVTKNLASELCLLLLSVTYLCAAFQLKNHGTKCISHAISSIACIHTHTLHAIHCSRNKIQSSHRHTQVKLQYMKV